MPAQRNRPKRDCFNPNANLPFQLHLEDFEISDLTKYQADVYHPLNRGLRGLEPVTMADLVIAKKIDSAIACAAIPRDMIVYRGIRRNVVNELEPGDTFNDNGFSSSLQTNFWTEHQFAASKIHSVSAEPCRPWIKPNVDCRPAVLRDGKA
jgi:hypothetical protein